MDRIHSVVIEWAISSRTDPSTESTFHHDDAGTVAVLHGMRCFNHHVLPICRIPTTDWDFFVHDADAASHTLLKYLEKRIPDQVSMSTMSSRTRCGLRGRPSGRTIPYESVRIFMVHPVTHEVRSVAWKDTANPSWT